MTSILVIGAAAPAAAVDLTGTWEGTLSCETLVNDNAPIRDVTRDNVLKIRMVSAWEFVATLNDSMALYGGALDDGRSLTRGEVVAQRCFPTAQFNTVLTANASVNAERSTGSLSGQLRIFILDPSPAFIHTCRASFNPALPVPLPSC